MVNTKHNHYLYRLQIYVLVLLLILQRNLVAIGLPLGEYHGETICSIYTNHHDCIYSPGQYEIKCIPDSDKRVFRCLGCRGNYSLCGYDRL